MALASILQTLRPFGFRALLPTASPCQFTTCCTFHERPRLDPEGKSSRSRPQEAEQTGDAELRIIRRNHLRDYARRRRSSEKYVAAERASQKARRANNPELLSHGLRVWVKRNMLAIQNKEFEWKVATPVYSEKVEHLCSTCDVFRSRKLWWEHPNGFECHDCYTKRDWETEVSPVGLEDHKFGELRALKKSPSGEPKH